MKCFLYVVRLVDFVDICVNRVAFPTPEEFDIVFGYTVIGSSHCGAFPYGMTRETVGWDASTEE
jgi:hypothetical protein